MVFLYDPEAGLITTAVRYAHTVLPSTLAKPEFWFLMCLHLLIAFERHSGHLQAADDRNSPFFISWRGIQIITALTIFFEIFYTDSCYTRYVSLYNVTRAMLGQTLDVTFEMRTYFGEEGHQYTRLATRYLLASVVLSFFELDASLRSPARGPVRVSESAWEQLYALNLAQADELEFLRELTGDKNASIIFLHWCASVAEVGWSTSGTPGAVIKSISNSLTEIRDLQAMLGDILGLPVPFQYFHLLNTMVAINMLLWAYGLAVSLSVFSPFIFCFCQVIFMGMMELASELENPFGRDDVDFAIGSWLSQTIRSTQALAEYQFPGMEGGRWEKVLLQQKKLVMAVEVDIYHDRRQAINEGKHEGSLTPNALAEARLAKAETRMEETFHKDELSLAELQHVEENGESGPLVKAPSTKLHHGARASAPAGHMVSHPATHIATGHKDNVVKPRGVR